MVDRLGDPNRKRTLRATVVSSMRNEGPFIVEWVAWQRLIGFTDIVVVTNDCTDRSADLLDALAQAGWVQHLRCDVPQGRPITATKLRAAHALPVVRRADWVMVCDVDEFLVIHAGSGRLTDLLPAAADAPFLGMSINWQVFGTSGRQTWTDGPVHRQFLQAGGEGAEISRWVKSVFRQPKWFGSLGEHGPKRLNLGRAGVPWGAPGMGWVNAAGRPVPTWTPDGDYLRRMPRWLTTHQTAQVNHYMLRSVESFGLKAGTRSPVGGRDRYTDAYFEGADRNEVFDDAALRHTGAFDALFVQAMALPGVARLHHLCCADYVERLCAKAGRDVADDPRHAQHLSRAG